MIVPAQNAWFPQDLHTLAEVGVAGVLLGAVVFGDEPGRIEAAVREFKAEAERIGPGRRSRTIYGRAQIAVTQNAVTRHAASIEARFDVPVVREVDVVVVGGGPRRGS